MAKRSWMEILKGAIREVVAEEVGVPNNAHLAHLATPVPELAPPRLAAGGAVSLTQDEWSGYHRELESARQRLKAAQEGWKAAVDGASDEELHRAFGFSLEVVRWVVSSVHPGTVYGVPAHALEGLAEILARRPEVEGHRQLPRALKRRAGEHRLADRAKDEVEREKEDAAELARAKKGIFGPAAAGRVNEDVVRAQEQAVAKIEPSTSAADTSACNGEHTWREGMCRNCGAEQADEPVRVAPPSTTVQSPAGVTALTAMVDAPAPIVGHFGAGREVIESILAPKIAQRAVEPMPAVDPFDAPREG